MKLAHVLKEIRIAAGMTQQQFADKLKLRQPYYAQMETGVFEPSDKTLRRLSKKFKVPMMKLILHKYDADIAALSESLQNKLYTLRSKI